MVLVMHQENTFFKRFLFFLLIFYFIFILFLLFNRMLTGCSGIKNDFQKLEEIRTAGSQQQYVDGATIPLTVRV